MERIITMQHIRQYSAHLCQEEQAAGTVKKYLRDVGNFAAWAGDRPVTRELAAAWKEHLAQSKAPVTVNGALAAVHSFLKYMDWQDCRVKYLKIQKKLFRENSRELTKEEYSRLVSAARSRQDTRLALLLETICATGIRVSEVPYITVEAARRGRADIALKGKIRTVLIPSKLARKLIQYARNQKTASGEIFLTRSGKSMSRGQIWAQMKALCQAAGVEESKVFPHNLRHLFARTYYKMTHDIAKLADVLGHSSIETTRIYLISTGAEHARQLEKLGLVV